MKKLYKFKFKEKDIKIVPLGDLHLGHPNCDEDAILDAIDYVKRRRNCYIIGMGDWMDLATKTSLGSVYDQKMTPTQQIETLYTWFKPVKKKILLMLAGNHEYNRVEKYVNLNPVEILAKQLDAPLYAGYTAMMKVEVRYKNYHFYETHGTSSATTIGGKLNALLRLGNMARADVYLHAHVHHLLAHSQSLLIIRNKEVEEIKRYFVLTGHFLDYADSYAEKKAYAIGEKGFMVIKLYGNKWGIEIEKISI